MDERCNTSLVEAALKMLGIRRLALAIHDVSLPSEAAEDVGRGSPYSRGGLEFFRFARSLGFNAVQLGPQGKTTRDDPSPYNSCIFSSSILSLAPAALADEPRLCELKLKNDLDRLLDHTTRHRATQDAGRADCAAAWTCADRLLDLVHARFREHRDDAPNFVREFQSFLDARRSDPVDWFRRDGIFEAISHASGTEDWRRWGEPGTNTMRIDQRLFCPKAGEEKLCRQRIDDILNQQTLTIERYALGQFLLHLQHQRMRDEARRLGLRIYGDMHIGCSHQDWWAWRSLFLPHYLLGAPPSRTNPAGQPWAYPVYHPLKLSTIGPDGNILPGPALDFVRARAEKMLTDYDGIRIDHPQGWVCPWVYRADDPDPFRAVQQGARLYSSPNLPDHPELSQFALVRPEQITPEAECPRYGDEHVRELSSEQVDRYAIVLDAILDCARSRGGTADDILCEVLSTWPSPLKAVMQQRGMGRFCITQKADPRNPNDVYRPEKTSPGDWIMVGNHDTKPLRLVIDEKQGTPWMRDRAELLASRLAPTPQERSEFVERIASDQRLFCDAMFAELFLGPAQNVSVFFCDLLGERRLYNEPGLVSSRNWTLRVPPDYQSQYEKRAKCGEALDLRRSLAMALEAKSSTLGEESARLARQLRQASDFSAHPAKRE